MSNKASILSTTLLDRSLKAKADGQDIELDEFSFIEIATNDDNDVRAEVELFCSLSITAVFTSANAVKAIVPVLEMGNPQWNIYCIGGATKKAVLEYFNEDDVAGIADDAAGLADLIVQDNVFEVVFFCGDKRMDTLPQILQDADTLVYEVIVYHTLETPVAVTKHYDGILFFSPSGVNSFFRANKTEPGTVLFAIGETTATALMEHSTNTIITGSTRSKEALAEEAIQYFNKRSPAATGAGK